LGADEATGEILAAVVTLNDCHEGEVFADVLEGIQSAVEQVSTGGAYDDRHCDDDMSWSRRLFTRSYL